MAEYRIATGWRIFTILVAVAMITVFFLLLCLPLIPSAHTQAHTGAYLALAPVALAMIAVMALALLDTIKNRLIIDERQLLHITGLYKRVLPFADIRGYRIRGNVIVIESIHPGQKKLRVSRYLERFAELQAWLAARYPDLDAADARQRREDILADDAYGETAEARQASLRNARQLAGTLNGAGIVVGLLAFIHPQPYRLVMVVDLLVPLAALAALRFSGGLIRPAEQKSTGLPNVFLALLMPALALCTRGIIDVHLLSYHRLWQLAGLIAAILVALTYVGNKGLRIRKGRAVGGLIATAILTGLFAFGTLIFINCTFDRSAAVEFFPSVLSKRESRGRSTSYYLELAPWGNQKSSSELSVPAPLYRQLNPGMIVLVQRRHGLLGMHWYVVRMP